MVVNEVNTAGHVNVLVALNNLCKKGAALEVDNSNLRTVRSYQTNLTRSNVVVKSCFLNIVNACNQVAVSLLVNAYPVKLGFVSKVQVRICSPTTITYTLVEDEVEGFVERPLLLAKIFLIC